MTLQEVVNSAEHAAAQNTEAATRRSMPQNVITLKTQMRSINNKNSKTPVNDTPSNFTTSSMYTVVTANSIFGQTRDLRREKLLRKLMAHRMSLPKKRELENSCSFRILERKGSSFLTLKNVKKKKKKVQKTSFFLLT